MLVGITITEKVGTAAATVIVVDHNHCTVTACLVVAAAIARASFFLN